MTFCVYIKQKSKKYIVSTARQRINQKKENKITIWNVHESVSGKGNEKKAFYPHLIVQY